jgi:hypothetical protein
VIDTATIRASPQEVVAQLGVGKARNKVEYLVEGGGGLGPGIPECGMGARRVHRKTEDSDAFTLMPVTDGQSFFVRDVRSSGTPKDTLASVEY